MGSWGALLFVGFLSLVAGIASLIHPFAASMTVELMAGWSFCFLGILQIIVSFSADGWKDKVWSLLLGVVALLTGVSLVTNPLAGMIALTVILGALFLTSGLFKLIIGIKIQEKKLKYVVLFSGAISIVLGVLVLSNIPESAAVALGVMLAVELISNGVCSISFAIIRKNIEKQLA